MSENMMWLKRPNLKEDDADVENLRNQFLRDRCGPSAKFVRCGKSASSEDNLKEYLTHEEKFSHSHEGSGCLDPTTGKSQVLFDVVEKDIIDLSLADANLQPNVSPTQRLNHSKAKKSIFLQRLERQNSMGDVAASLSAASGSKTYGKPTQSYVIDGTGLGLDEAKKLCEENMQKIASMSSEDIANFQKEIMSSLSEEKINFLRSKRQKSAVLSNSAVSGLAKVSLSKKVNLSGDPLEKTLKDSREHNRDAIILEDITDGLYENENPQKCDLGGIKSEKPIDVPLDELPIHPSDTGQWINMNVVEKDKLAWMTMLPKPKAVDSKTGSTARFDFEGRLLSRSLDVPTQLGLHHHSNEPEVAGYSIEELFILIRSASQSQRIIALQTLAHILENHWDGRFDDCFDKLLLSTLLEAGLAPMLRWSLDDNSLSSLAAAVLAIHHLLICKSDEICLDRTFCWLGGHIGPYLTGENIEPDVNIEELIDVNVIKLDIIEGFLRIDLLPRFRWILRKLCPPKAVCELVIEICIRIVRHSQDSAKKVMVFPFLMNTIFEKFMPVHYNGGAKLDNTSDFAYPLAAAVKLVRVISSAKRCFAEYLIKHHPVIKILESYLTIDPSDGKLPPAEAQNLIIESLRLWQTLLSYGFSTDVYINLSPIVYRQFLFCQSLSINTDVERNFPNYEYAAHFLKALEVVVVASSGSFTTPSQNQLSWNDVMLLGETSIVCLKRWLIEFTIGPTSFSGRVLLSSCLNFASVFIDGCIRQGIPISHMVKDVVENYLCLFMSSKSFSELLRNLSSASVLMCDGPSGCKRDTANLISTGSVLWKGDLLPFLAESTSFPIVLSIFNFLCRLDSSDQKLLLLKLPVPIIEKYLNHIVDIVAPFSHCFDGLEVQLLVNIVDYFNKMGLLKHLIFKTSLLIVQTIKSPYEFLLQKVLQNIIFHPSYFQCTSEIVHLNLPSGDLCPFYTEFLVAPENLNISRLLLGKSVKNTRSLSYDSKKLVTSPSWTFSPLNEYYERSKSKESEKLDAPSLLADVKKILHWIHMNSIDGNHSCIDNVPINARFAYFCLIFIIDSEAFLDEQVREILSWSLHNIVQIDKNIDLVNMKWDHLPSFEQIFTEMLIQFEAVSYGDELFANFLLLPLEQQYPSEWRILVFQEHEHMIGFLKVPLNKVIVPIENFLQPYETNEVLLQKYFKLLASKNINPVRCPLLYLIAVHHLHHFVYNSFGQNKKFRAILQNSLDKVKDQEFCQHITLYSTYDVNSDLGIMMKNDTI